MPDFAAVRNPGGAPHGFETINLAYTCASVGEVRICGAKHSLTLLLAHYAPKLDNVPECPYGLAMALEIPDSEIDALSGAALDHVARLLGTERILLIIGFDVWIEPDDMLRLRLKVRASDER